VANVEAKKKRGLRGHSKESGRCHQVQANLATFEAAAMHGFVTTNRMGDFVSDAVGDVTDQYLGPGIVLGGGGGEDMVEEVWWQTWRRRKRWRRGLRGQSKELGQCHQVRANLATFEAAAMHCFVTTNRKVDFVSDAVGDVWDRDLGPGIVLGGGGDEDVIEEVWWRTWRQRKRWRRGL
jgi:hypothetical protein